MDTFLFDTEINALIIEQKQMTIAPDNLLRNMKEKRGHKENEHVMARADSSSFVLKLRLSMENPLDFSAILGFIPVNLNKPFLLRRYNGKSHQHRNKLEQTAVFYDFHIHTATERYQREGTKEEFFAEITNRYSTINEALNCLIQDCNIILPVNTQLNLGLD